MAVRMYQGVSKEFVEACAKATKATGRDIKPTMRQHRKWLKRQGSAWANREGD